MNMKTGLAALVTALLLLPGIAQADELPMKAEAPITLTSPSAILCEASTGQVIAMHLLKNEIATEDFLV